MQIVYVDGGCGITTELILGMIRDNEWHHIAVVSNADIQEEKEEIFKIESKETYREKLEFNRKQKGKYKKRFKDWHSD